MFCKICGKEIDKDSIFCKHCGSKQSDKNEISITTTAESTDEKTNNITSPDATNMAEETSINWLGIFIFIISIFFFVILIVSISTAVTSKNNNSNKKLLSRDAKISDILIDSEYNFPISIDLVIRPYEDIDNLELTIKYINTSQETIKTQIKTIGNVKEGQEYRIQILLTDFSMSEIARLSYCQYTISDGEVPLIG